MEGREEAFYEALFWPFSQNQQAKSRKTLPF
jgi:hypothetical protein